MCSYGMYFSLFNKMILEDTRRRKLFSLGLTFLLMWCMGGTVLAQSVDSTDLTVDAYSKWLAGQTQMNRSIDTPLSQFQDLSATQQ